MTYLHQLLAIEKGVRDRVNATIGELERLAKVSGVWQGLTKTYQPKDADAPTAEFMPPESTLVQQTAGGYLATGAEALSALYDVGMSKEVTNLKTHADVVIDGEVILEDLPSPALLYLANRLEELRKFVAAIPTLDPASRWFYDPGTGIWETPDVQTVKTRKTPRNHVRYEATKEHPAQVDVFTEDVVIGTWTGRALSGAMPPTRKHAILGRIDTLADAVRTAREEANRVVVTDVLVGKRVFDYLLAE